MHAVPGGSITSRLEETAGELSDRDCDDPADRSVGPVTGPATGPAMTKLERKTSQAMRKRQALSGPAAQVLGLNIVVALGTGDSKINQYDHECTDGLFVRAE
jgi:hypothetical protein